LIEQGGAMTQPWPPARFFAMGRSKAFDAWADSGAASLQAYLGHKNIQHTVRYTELAKYGNDPELTIPDHLFALVGSALCPYAPCSAPVCYPHSISAGQPTASTPRHLAVKRRQEVANRRQPNSALWVGGANAAGEPDAYRLLNLFGDVFERVRADYVEKPDDAKLVEYAISGMLTGLDPHSSYMDAKSLGDMQVETRGQFGGLGIEVTMEDGLIKVVAPIDDTPAAKAGVLANDIIVKLDDGQVQGMTLNQAIEKMRGAVNTKIKLTIVRKGQDKPVEVSITREVIRVRSARWHTEGDDIGYVRLTQFNEQTTEGLKKGIAEIQSKIPEEKLKGYILDLRNNPGGLLDQAISVADAFLETGEIVSTRGRNAEEMARFNARPGDLAHGKPLIVLVNGGSASASEIVAGALQDHKRATVVGTRSFGKGSVQTIIPLGSGNGALRLTTARYYTPSGRSIQAKGITPDVEVLQDIPPELKNQTDIHGEASLRGHLTGDAGKEQTGSQFYVPPDPKDDKALHVADDLLRGVQANSAPSQTTKPAERP
jgi:carboxyl-terminal processing protease